MTMNEVLYFLATMILIFYLHAIEASEGKVFFMFAWSCLFFLGIGSCVWLMVTLGYWEQKINFELYTDERSTWSSYYLLPIVLFQL